MAKKSGLTPGTEALAANQHGEEEPDLRKEPDPGKVSNLSTAAAIVAAIGSLAAAGAAGYGVRVTNETQTEVVELGAEFAAQAERLQLFIQYSEELNEAFGDYMRHVIGASGQQELPRPELLRDLKGLQDKGRYLLSDRNFEIIAEQLEEGESTDAVAAFFQSVSEATCREIREIVHSESSPTACSQDIPFSSIGLP